MNKRLQKKVEKRKRAEVHELLDIALRINGVEERKCSVSGVKPTAMFCFSGHVAGVDMSFYDSGWSRENSATENYMVWFADNAKEREAQIKRIKQHARRLLPNNRNPFN